MNPNYNDQDNSNSYQGKSIFDASQSQSSYGQLPPASPPPKKHTLIIILTISIVVVILLVGLIFAMKSAKKQTTNNSADKASNSQTNQTQVPGSQNMAEQFLTNILSNKFNDAQTQTSPQFQDSVKDTQLKNLISTLSNYVGKKSTFKLSNKIVDATIQFDNDNTTYAAASYVFSLKNTSQNNPFYVMVNVVQTNNKWLVYGFEYNSKQIQPNVNTNGRYELSK